MNCERKRNPKACRKRTQSGMALVLVLWMVTLLTVIAGSFSLGIHREASTVHHLIDAAKARAAAEAGIRFAMLALIADHSEVDWKINSGPHEVAFADAILTIRIRDEAGRVDINTAGSELISKLLATSGLQDTEQRETLVANILDWRDAGAAQGGTTSSDSRYRAAGFDYGPRNGPFVSVEELLLIPGMSPLIYRRLLPLITTHSGQTGIAPAAADREVLLALPGTDPATVEAYLAQRETAREQGLPDPDFPYPAFGASSAMTYSIESVARLPSGLEHQVRAVVVPQPAAQGGEPFGIIHFRSQESL